MSLAQRIAAKRAEVQRNVIEVPEWGEGDNPLRLYAGPVTARDLEKIQRKHKDFLSNVTMGAMVEMIILKCEDENGDQVFTLEDKPILMGEPIGVVSVVFSAVFGSTSIEDHIKN